MSPARPLSAPRHGEARHRGRVYARAGTKRRGPRPRPTSRVCRPPPATGSSGSGRRTLKPDSETRCAALPKNLLSPRSRRPQWRPTAKPAPQVESAARKRAWLSRPRLRNRRFGVFAYWWQNSVPIPQFVISDHSGLIRYSDFELRNSAATRACRGSAVAFTPLVTFYSSPAAVQARSSPPCHHTPDLSSNKGT